MKEHLQRLINDLADHDHTKAYGALTQLAEMGPEAAPAAESLYRLLLNDGERGYRGLIAQILVKLAPTLDSGSRGQIRYNLIRSMVRPKDFSPYTVAFSCSQVLIAMGPDPTCTNELVELLAALHNEYDNATRSLTSDDLLLIKGVVIDTLCAWGKSAPSYLVPTFIEWLKHTDFRRVAKIILMAIGTPALPALHEITGLFSNYPSDVKQSAREVIRYIKNHE